MTIRSATANDFSLLADIVSSANKDVAQQFNITFENNPKHPSFYTSEWVEKDFQRGEQYFIYESDSRPVACVAYEKPSAELAYLNRLSVSPEHRKRGVGEALVQYIFQLAKHEKIKTISIGIIGEHVELHRWYQKLGFKDTERKQFAHLPFSVQLMTYQLDV